MNTLSKKESIEVLKKLRDVYQSQLDTSVIAELNEVIAALERSGCDCSGSDTAEDWPYRALKVIGQVLRIITDITSLMN